jgi:hypothetical protein
MLHLNTRHLLKGIIMSFLAKLCGYNYEDGALCSPDEMAEALMTYADMLQQGVKARLVIRRDNDGFLTLNAVKTSDLGVGERVRNFFLGTSSLLNVKTVMERIVPHLQSSKKKSKIQKAVVYLNGPLLSKYHTLISFGVSSSPLLQPASTYSSLDRAVPTPFIQKLKNKHQEQIQIFEQFARQNEWYKFRPDVSHYDWWAFPIIITHPNPSSTSRAWAVTAEDIATLQHDPEFMARYRRGVQLVVLSWGWDLEHDHTIPPDIRKPDQQWTGYVIRLGKMADSLRMFGEKELFRRLKTFYEQVVVPYSLSHGASIDSWIRELFARPLP